MEKKPDIKIFVSHRIDLDSETIDNPLYVNVRCGAVFDKRENVDMLGDDTGDNISSHKHNLSELTVMYWAWKNVDAEYYGLCHYRRYFSFSDIKYAQDEYSNITENHITTECIKKYCMDDVDRIKKVVADYDCIVTTPFDVKKVGLKNLREQYNFQKFLIKEDLDTLVEVIDEISPEYSSAAREYLDGNKLVPCLMFIMKKDLFFVFSKWVFSIIAELEKRINVENYSQDGIRTIAHLAERLLGIFLLYVNGKVSIKYVQRVLFWHTEKEKILFPLEKAYIPVVFSSSNYYVPYLYITIYSMLENADTTCGYEITILNTDINVQNKEKIRNLEKRFCNARIRFFDVSRMLEQYDFIANNHVSIETFYRLFIPIIFKEYKKVIFLDSDLIIKGDIKKLYDLSDDQYVISATRDLDYESQYNAMLRVKKYTNEILGISDVKKYFQAGVLVFNVAKYNQKYHCKKLLEFASDKEFMYVDQDVMNSVLYGDIFYISNQWNVMTDCAGERLNNIKMYASNNSYRDYLLARKNPYIIHYAGWAKPWNRPEDDFADEFWIVARKTIFYEIILARMSGNMAWGVVSYDKSVSGKILNKIINLVMPKNKKARLIVKKYINEIVSIFAPIGTKRRSVLKQKYNSLRGRY